MGYISAEVICGNANFAIPDATLGHFGGLISTMHNASLVRAHQALDRAVDAAYAAYAADAKALGFKSTWNSERERVAFLFALDQRLTNLPENSERC